MKNKSLAVLLVILAFILTWISGYAFSDEYEPYYPHITAVTRSVDEIYQRISGPDMVLSDEIVNARKEMIQMYKDVGIDVSLDMENWLKSYRMISDFPQRWSTKTPIPLGTSPDYSGAFSIDAPWNNKIPKDAPRTYIPTSSLKYHMNLAVVKADVDNGGWGTGIPQIVSTSSDPYITIGTKYNLGNISKVLMVHAREDFYSYINNGQHGDEHIMFIDGENHTGVQTWASRTMWDPRGYKLQDGALPGYTVRAGASGVEHRLDGIGAEGQAGVNASNAPTSAFTIKSSEISSTTDMLSHAIGGAIGQVVGARVFPTVSVDAGNKVVDGHGQNKVNAFGIVPYGGVIQLDPELDLDTLYNSGKLSFHAYRILKCMQEYGYYNIDQSGGDGTSSILLYTSTYSNDWINPEFRGFDVPYADNTQGFDKVCKELQAFLYNDWEWFGYKEQPKLYVTVPVVKYADLDVNDDGVIDIIDHDLVVENVGNAYTDANKQYDVNQDKELSVADIEIMYNYLNDQPMHTFTWHDISFINNDETHGRIVISGTSRTEGGLTQYRDGMMISVSTVPVNGWEFDGWTGDFAEYGKTPVVKILELDRSYSIGAKYKKKPEVNLTVKVNGPGHVEISETGIGYEAPKDKYGIDTLVMFKAVADEGYEFLGWGGDAIGFTNPLDVVLDSDKEIIALFGKAGYVDDFNPDNWEHVSGNSDTYTIKAGKGIEFNSDAFKHNNQIVINNNKDKQINLKDDFSIRIRINKNNNSDDNIHGGLIFNYKNEKNYYYLSVGCSGYVELGKCYNGVSSVLKGAGGKKGNIVVNGVLFKPEIDIEVIRKGAYLYVTGYKDGEKYEYFKVRDKSLKDGTIGVIASYYGYGGLSKITVSNAVVDADKAAIQKWSPNGDIGPWTKRLGEAVVVAVDSDKAYVKNEYTTITNDGSIRPYFADDGMMIYVPVRYVTEKLGGKVSYDPATDSVIVSYGDSSGSFKAWTNGAQEINGTLYVPVRDLAKALGREYYIYERVAFISDTENVYTDVLEPECIEFVKKAFDIQYYM